MYCKCITSYLSSEYLKTIEFNNEQREKYIRMKNRVGTVNFKELSNNLISASRVQIIEKIGQGEQ